MNQYVVELYQNIMKFILIILIGIYGFHLWGQASSSSDFQFKVKFDQDISVLKLQPYYLLKAGNNMAEITYELDTTENSITISGHNEYVLWVAFPTIVFTITEEMKIPSIKEKVERTFAFYLISEGPLSSYTGPQKKELKFSYEKAIIVASLVYHNKENMFKNLKIERPFTLSGHYQNLSLGNELISIKN